MQTKLWKALLIAGLVAGSCAAYAQDNGGGEGQGPGRGARGQFAGMQRVTGEVTAVSGASITIKGEDGTTYTVATTDNTRVMKGRGDTEKVSDIKPGDAVTAAGNLDAPSKTLHAGMVMVVDAAMVKAMKENLGKTYIVGKVTAIDVDNAKMTVERQDKVSQTIGFDETTSFKRGRGAMGMMGMGGGMGMGAPGGGVSGGGRAPAADAGESITLADIKVGDMVSGQGSVKSGTFVPSTLMVSTPGQGGGGRRGGQGAPGAGAPPPPPTPPPSAR